MPSLGKRRLELTKLSLTNFRSFGEQTQTITFGKVTFLFGPNSVGKSTVLLAIFYVRELLSGNNDPEYIEALGDKWIGGFENLVHGKDLSKTIKIKMEFKTGEIIGRSYFDVIDLMKSGEIPLVFDEDKIDNLLHHEIESPSVNAATVGVELEIAYNNNLGGAFISSLVIEMDEILIVRLTSPDGFNSQISEINYSHPLLLPENYDDWLLEQYDNGPVHPDCFERLSELTGLDFGEWDKEEDDDIPEDIKWEDIPHLGDELCFVSSFHKYLCVGIPPSEYDNGSYMIGSTKTNATLLHAPISFDGMNGALPNLGNTLLTTFEDKDILNKKIAHEVLSDVIVAPLDNLLDFLNAGISIGPTRVIPEKTYLDKKKIQQKNWFDGSAAWSEWQQHLDSIFDMNNTLTVDGPDLSEVFSGLDQWLSKIGYDIEVHLAQENTGQYNTKTKETNVENEIKSKIKFVFKDKTNGTYVEPSEIGVGISQIFPLLVAVSLPHHRFVGIEQPELHVHPRIQVELGDLFTQSGEENNFIVESHSEHIMLRLLKRIRQTTDEELPDGFLAVKPSDISVNYLDSTKNGVQITRLNISEDGEFIEKWPDGFFVERREELW